MTEGRHRKPASDEAPHAIPKDAAFLAAPRQRAMPKPPYLEPKEIQRRLVHGHPVVADVSPHHCLQPLAYFGDGFMHPSLKFGFHLVQFRLQPFADRLPQHRKPSIAPLLYAYMRVSRPAEFHHRPLAEPSVRLSPHSAPIRQTGRPYGPSVTRIEFLLFPGGSGMRPPDSTPSLQLHYEPSSLVRVGPPQCSASVRSPRRFGRLGFSLSIRATGSCSSTRWPASASRPLYTGRRPHSHQAPRGPFPGGLYAPGSDDTCFLNDASSKGSLSFVSRMLTCTGLFPRFYSNAHHHGLLPQQLGSVWDLLLKADPEGSSLIYCAACDPHGYLVHIELLIRAFLQHTKAQKVERLRLPCSTPLPLVDRKRTELQKSRLLGMQFQVELLHSFRKFRPELFGIRFAVKAHHDVVRESHHDHIAVCALLKDSLWSIDLFRCASATLRSHWVLVVMDQYTRRIIGFGVHAGTLNGAALCRIFNRAIRGQLWMPKYLSSDNDPLYRFHRWQANLRILEATEIKSIPYVPLSHPFVERLVGTIRREYPGSHLILDDDR